MCSVPGISVAECAICLGGFQDNEFQPMKATPLPCDLRHVFHTECIKSWFKNENNCPLCKKTVTQKDMKNMPNIIKQQMSVSINR